METVSLYKKKYHVELRDVDFTKKLKLSTLFGYFQDIASEAVDNLGIGIEILERKYGLAWILMRIRVEIIRYPEWNEEIIIETWAQQPKKLEFERDFIVRDLKGNVIIRAISTWIIVDIKTKKVRKSELIAIEYPEIIRERAIDCKLGKLKPFGQPIIAYRKVIGYSDVDFNGHLNNSRYVDFIMDCFSMENHKVYEIKGIEVNYVNEALPGDTLILYKDASALSSNLVYLEGVREKDDKLVFKAEVEIKEREKAFL
ncbi:MAG TPA: acyl-ACP thioesterase [Clostridia bacterium]|jgi:acyl-ACP thioesterase|nr:acyl-ACP thioesterase [Clostridia bacterium]